MPGPDAGRFEPVKASVQANVVSTNSTTGEKVITYSESFKTYIRFLATIGREGTTADQVISSTQIKIRLRKTPLSEAIRPYWRIIHSGATYGIIAVNPQPNSSMEIELLCDRLNQ
jgi:hypothetical protein